MKHESIFLQEALGIKDDLVKWRRDFHRNPEPSGQEFETAHKISAYLEELGFSVQTNVGAPMPGVIGTISGTKCCTPTVALRADMDALRQTEACESCYRSQKEGLMHGCGHDAHMAIQLGVARLLSAHRDTLPGTVKLIFQPSEEIYGGAVPMIQAGALENPKVDAIFSLHVDPEYPAGELAVSYGETRAASDRLILHIKGKSGHGAYPHKGIDAIIIAAHVIVAWQSLMSREKDTFDPGILSFGIIEGGKQPNSVCDDVLLRGILRTLNPRVREQLITRLEEVVAGITKAFGGSYELERQISYDAMINDRKMAELQKQVAEDLIGADKVHILPHAKMGVEDFSYFLQKVPGAMCFLGVANAEKNIVMPLHSTYFDLDEDALPVGVAMQMSTIWRYLENHNS